MIHNIPILLEGLIKSTQINHELEDQTQTAHARAEVSDELLQVIEERERKSREKISLLEAELASLVAQQRNKKEDFKKLKIDYQKEMESVESTLTKEKERVRKAKKAAKEVENAAKEVENAIEKAEKTIVELQEKLTVAETRAQKAASQVLVEFRKSKEYKDELVDIGMDAFQLKFMECKKQIHHLVS